MERKSEENKSARYRNICFTVNNYTEEIYEKIKNSKYFNFVIIGREISSTGTPHLQGYGELKYQMRLGSIMKNIHPMHVEARRGTQAQAINYCQKDNNFIEIGEKNKQGELTDLKEIVDAVKSGKTRAEILESGLLQTGFQMQYESKCRTYLSDKKRERPEVIWIYGSTGTGKTEMINKLEELRPEQKIFDKDNTKWWNGYDYQHTVLMDDFRPSSMKFYNLLKIMDKRPFAIETKGGVDWFKSKRIIITTCKDPETLYEYKKREDTTQLLRRITKTYCFDYEVVKNKCEEYLLGNSIPADINVDQ